MKQTTKLFDNRWLSLNQIQFPERNVPGYIFSREESCNGQKVAVLPYRYDKEGDMELLLRKEYTPCWSEELIVSSITGGVEKNDPFHTVIEELKEEAGFMYLSSEEPETRIQELGTCFGVKSTDTVFYLYAVNVQDLDQEEPTTTDLQEKESHCFWVKDHNIGKIIPEIGDPILAMLLVRFTKLLNDQEEKDVQH